MVQPPKAEPAPPPQPAPREGHSPASDEERPEPAAAEQKPADEDKRIERYRER